MTVNLFLSSYTWAGARSPFGPLHHFRSLYEEVFRDYEVSVFPKELESNLIASGMKHVPAVLKGDINVLAQGYPIIAGALTSLLRRDPRIIVHTWKVPGITDERLTARAYDVVLRRSIGKARAVVVASMPQKRQVEALEVPCPVVFAPVTVDSSFWRPEPPNLEEALARFKLKRDGYVLTVGSTDRDETYAAVVARMLGLTYVRSSWGHRYAERAREQLAARNLDGHTRILVNPSDIELRALYAGAFLVCLPTITRTNPAGLSALVETMACGTLAAIPEPLAEGYIEDGINGLVLRGVAEQFVTRVLSLRGDFSSIRKTARLHAEKKLNHLVVGRQVRERFRTEGVVN